MDRDPIFGHQQRTMSRMMDSFFGGNEFGFGNSLLGSHGLMPFGGTFGGFPGMMGGMGMMNPFGGFPDMGQVMNDPNSHSFCSTSVMSVTAGPDGRQQVYHASSATRQAPGGVKETRKTLADTRTGTKKMSLGRHLGDRAHVREREENMHTGQREENEDFLNIEEEEAEGFNQEWRQRAYSGHHHSALPAIGSFNPHPAYNHNHRAQLQLTQRPHHRTEHSAVGSSGGVTIEELPPSDNEEQKEDEGLEAQTAPRTSRVLPSIPRVGRRNAPKESRSASKRTKKY